MKYLILPCKVHAVVESIQAVFFNFYAFVLHNVSGIKYDTQLWLMVIAHFKQSKFKYHYKLSSGNITPSFLKGASQI